jgi:outer membrane protein OmpA-like peptidoglycan-associated protein
MKLKTLIVISIVIVVFAAVFGALLVLQSRERLVMRSPMLTQEPSIITYFEGPVEISLGSDPEDEWLDAEIGMRLKENSRLRTGPGGLVDLRIYSDGLIRLLENSEIALVDLTIRRQTVNISRGMVFAKFRLLFDKQDLRFLTPNTAAAVRGTELVIVVNESGTEVNALSGITEIHNLSVPDERILLAFQTSTRIEGSTPPSDPEELKPVMVAQYRREFNGINSREVFLISQDINFKPDSSVILEESLLELDEVARLLKLRRINILIAGQVRLSETRAESIREELISRGISPKRLSTTGFGGSRPVGDNAFAEGRALNRRVEFLVVV